MHGWAWITRLSMIFSVYSIINITEHFRVTVGKLFGVDMRIDSMKTKIVHCKITTNPQNKWHIT